MSAAVKVLTVGPALGAIRQLFAKIKAIDAKNGKFDFALCVGDFFGGAVDGADETQALLDGLIEAPMECYIMQGKAPLPDAVIQRFAKTHGELTKNVFLLTKSGIITTANGLRIACLGGIYDSESYSSSAAAPGFASPFFASQTTERLLANTLSSSSTQQDYKSLAAIQSNANNSHFVDILITNVWPSSIPAFSSVPIALSQPEIASWCAPPLDDIVRRLQPRYHLTVGAGQTPVFWEREPYTWTEGEDERVARFVALGAFGGPPPQGKKLRWFYAFSITPNTVVNAASATRPANTSKNPFMQPGHTQRKREVPHEDDSGGGNFIWGTVARPAKRAKTEDNGVPPDGYKCKICQRTGHFIDQCPDREAPPEGYLCRVCNVSGHFVRDCPTRNAPGDTGGRKPKEGYVCRGCGSENHFLDDCPQVSGRPRGGRQGGGGNRHTRGPPKEITVDECWFCLSSPNLAKHLIVAIGTECYVTLPKGQIVPTQSAASHVDIPGGGHVLIVPISHFPTLNTIAADLAPPIVEEVEGYKNALRAMYAKYQMTPVFFEVARLRQKGGHAHVQAVPIPVALQDKVEEAFLEEGRMYGVDFEATPEDALKSCSNGMGSYFRVDLPTGGMLVHIMKDGVPFSLQFGRQVLANLLQAPDRVDWKDCVLTDEEDKADADAFKKAFAPFNPSV